MFRILSEIFRIFQDLSGLFRILSLELKNLSIRFKTDAGYINALKDFSLSLKKNQIIGIVGESGSGKSVSVNAILKLLPDKAELDPTISFC